MNNPFKIPDTDEELFKLRDKSSRGSMKIQNTKKSSFRSLEMELSKKLTLSNHDSLNNTSSSSEPRTNPNPNPKGSTIKNNNDKELMNDFINKKREMFLLQMGIDTKKEEIRKLEETQKSKEEELRMNEQVLEEDAIRFDAFLKENDKKAKDAIRQAEIATKRKLDKVQEIKKLNKKIQRVHTDITKNKEVLGDCLVYKNFLDTLTPPEWFEKHKRIKKERQETRRRRRIERKKEDWILQQKEFKEREELDSQRGRRIRRSRIRTPKEEKQDEEQKDEVTHEPDFDSDPLTSSDEEIPMYFTNPQQLIDIFTSLEEENLFLIQNSQETEQVLEELRLKFERAKLEMDTKTALMDKNINQLQLYIQEEENVIKSKSDSTENMSDANNGNNDETELLKDLELKVKEVFERCDLGEPGSNTLSTLSMLSLLEAKLIEIVEQLEELPQDYVAQAEKEKEKKRRELKRAVQQAQQAEAQEERVRKAIERSMKPPKKRTTKPVMFRSYVKKGKTKREKKELTQEEKDELKFLS